MRLALVALTWRIENSNMDFPIFQRMNDNRAGGCAANSDITYLRADIDGEGPTGSTANPASESSVYI